MEIRGGKRFRTRAERREIVLETLKPGISVAQVALAHGINSNQIFQWRRQYRENLLATTEPAGMLVPVRISDAVEKPQQRSRRESTVEGSIQIELARARVRIEGSADPDCVRAVLEGLLR